MDCLLRARNSIEFPKFPKSGPERMWTCYPVWKIDSHGLILDCKKTRNVDDFIYDRTEPSGNLIILDGYKGDSEIFSVNIVNEETEQSEWSSHLHVCRISRDCFIGPSVLATISHGVS